MTNHISIITHANPQPATALGEARAILDSVKAGKRGSTARIYRPQPTLAFGARDRFLAGFRSAIAAARKHHFTPVLRSLGGRVAPYHLGSLVVDHCEPAEGLYGEVEKRFAQFAQFYAEALQSLGISAEVGNLPGEYCPGEYSIHVGHQIKAVGTAQRVSKGGWLFSSSFIVENPTPIRAVLTDVQAALGMSWDPATGGSITELHPHITVSHVAKALHEAYSRYYVTSPGTLSPEEIKTAHRYSTGHMLA